MCGSFNLFLVVKEANISSSATTDQLELSFKPSEMIGTASCAIDDGHKIIAQFGDSLKLSKGLWFEMYRYKSTKSTTLRLPCTKIRSHQRIKLN